MSDDLDAEYIGRHAVIQSKWETGEDELAQIRINRVTDFRML